jgi:hypothetical protein
MRHNVIKQHKTSTFVIKIILSEILKNMHLHKIQTLVITI